VKSQPLKHGNNRAVNRIYFELPFLLLPQGKPSRIAEPAIAADLSDEDLKTPPKPSCLMEHPEDDPVRMFNAACCSRRTLQV
jgi:hypothetical protein